MSLEEMDEDKKQEVAETNIKVLFLDIDGVLNTLPQTNAPNTDSQHFFPLTRLNRLKQIIDSTNCKIVLSSSWRLRQHSKKMLFEKFNSVKIDVESCYKGDTPSTKKPRALQIHEYIVNCTEHISSWCAVDDLDLESTLACASIMKAHFVRTTLMTGLTDAKMNQIIDVLNSKQ
eukprot:788345_1